MAAADIAPRNGEFNDGKLWFQRKSKIVTIGLTNLAVEEIGEVQSVEFPDEGTDFVKGDTVLTVEGSNGKIEVIAPATGIIEEVNEAAKAEPDMVSEDPLEEGWLIKLEIEDTSDLKEFGIEADQD